MSGDERFPPRRRAPVPMGAVMDGVLQKLAGKSPLRELEAVRRCWADVAGTALAAVSSPVALRDGSLLVHVTSSAWLHRLQFMRDDLRGGLNGAIGRELVAELRFRVGPLAEERKGAPPC